jgi:hypothetical protein
MRTETLVQPEAQLDRHLPVIHIPFLKISAGINDLKPMQIVEGRRCLANRILNRVFDAGLEEPVNSICLYT